MSTTEGKTEEEGKTTEIKKSIVIDASPEVVFKAIIDPDELTKLVSRSSYFGTQGRRKNEVQFSQRK